MLDLIDGDFIDQVPAPWVPTRELPVAVQGICGLWFWGNSATEVKWHNEVLELRAMTPPGGVDWFELREGRFVGVHGYHRGEELHVVRGAGNEAVLLEASTFMYTRRPAE